MDRRPMQADGCVLQWVRPVVCQASRRCGCQECVLPLGEVLKRILRRRSEGWRVRTPGAVNLHQILKQDGDRPCIRHEGMHAQQQDIAPVPGPIQLQSSERPVFDVEGAMSLFHDLGVELFSDRCSALWTSQAIPSGF